MSNKSLVQEVFGDVNRENALLRKQLSLATKALKNIENHSQRCWNECFLPLQEEASFALKKIELERRG